MKHNSLKILIKLFPRLKKKNIKPTDDLIKNAVLDSLDLVTFITRMQKIGKFDVEKYQKKFKKFTLKNLDLFINKV